MDGHTFGDAMAGLRDAVDSHLALLLPDPGQAPHRLHAAMNYALLAPGKRLRPILALLTAESLGARRDVALGPACAIELVHAASLVLDDLPCMDDAQMRRGQPATHLRYGEEVAILAAVALLNQAFGIISRTPGLPADRALEMVRELSAAIGLDGLVAGQEKDLRRDENLSLGRLQQINEQKTGVLFAAAVHIGGAAAGANLHQREALHRFALEFGLAFQALDDLEDLENEDFGRPTVASLLGREAAGGEAFARLQAAKDALRAGDPAVASLEPKIDLLLGLG